MAESKTGMQLKLLIDSKAHRVLFGEADKNFIDFLFNLLSLPLGTVIRLLNKENMVGCLANLYESVETLNDTYLQPNKNRDHLLNPKVMFSGLSKLLPDIDSSTSDTAEKAAYLCQNYGCNSYFADHAKAICPHCNDCMSKVGTYVKPPITELKTSTEAGGGTGGYVKGVVTYMVMDDLSVKPMSTISSITLLNKFHIKDVGVLEEKVLNLDVDQGVKLLEASLHSKTVLTDLFLGKKVTI